MPIVTEDQSARRPCRVARPTLRVSYDAEIDFLLALIPGEVIDGQPEEQIHPFARRPDPVDGDEEFAWFYTRPPEGELIGFGIGYAFQFPIADVPPDAPVWGEPRFDVPTLAVWSASVGEILLAAQASIRGSTPDVVFFHSAIAEKEEHGDLEAAEAVWRSCLEAGDLRGHFGLGYTLCDLGRPREAFGHLAMYTEVCPRNAWAWVWRGRAAEDMDEFAEAVACYRRAIECEEAGGFDTDAATFLARLL